LKESIEAQALQAVTQWEGGILQVKVPLPFSLRWVNSYLIDEGDGYTLIDPGLRTEEAERLWTAVLEQQQISIDQIRAIILTHQHPDHYGLAGWFQLQSGAPVYMSAQSHAYAVRLWGPQSSFGAELTSLYAEHGMPELQLKQITPHLESFVARVSPQPKITLLAAGETITFGGQKWQTIDAPGHARGQLCFYSPEQKWMFCGDQVLPHITPNISVVPGEDEDPLQRFMDSLIDLQQFDVELAFPGHRDPFTDFRERTEALIAHHERRLDQIVELLTGVSITAFEVCEAMFGARISGNAHQLRFAMSEALAHLYHLDRKARVQSTRREGFVYYSA